MLSIRLNLESESLIRLTDPGLIAFTRAHSTRPSLSDAPMSLLSSVVSGTSASIQSQASMTAVGSSEIDRRFRGMAPRGSRSAHLRREWAAATTSLP